MVTHDILYHHTRGFSIRENVVRAGKRAVQVMTLEREGGVCYTDRNLKVVKGRKK